MFPDKSLGRRYEGSIIEQVGYFRSANFNILAFNCRQIIVRKLETLIHKCSAGWRVRPAAEREKREVGFAELRPAQVLDWTAERRGVRSRSRIARFVFSFFSFVVPTSRKRIRTRETGAD